MKQDLEALMKANHADALWITGPAQHNPPMVYLTGGAHITNADLFKKSAEVPYLCHEPMERDEAAKSGYKLISYAKYNYKELLKEADGDYLTVSALRYKQILTDIGLTKGRVFLYGQRDIGNIFTILNKLKEMLPGLELLGDGRDAILMQAMATKDTDEIERIRKMGHLTTMVVGKTAEFLSAHKVKEEVLIKDDGQPLLIGDVKRLINLWIAELGAENPEDTIFAIGSDAGVPHSNGTPSDIIRLGQTIVFDIFPCEAGGGYFYDFTRTWCLGYAPDEAQALYDQVKSVYNTITSELKTGQNANVFQERTCELFEEMGHPTIRKDPQISSGYVHSLGHGVGLNVHEKPWFGRPEDPSNTLTSGSVFTIEPGLYYPVQGMGVRLEDTYFVSPQGSFEKFADFPMDLVLPIKGK
ncbi:MAG: M24 family metallopeptidase [Chloroflexota bacterium]